MFLLNQREMKLMDSTAINEYGIPSLVLMERAALSARDYITQQYDLGEHVVIFSGTGNNGADGMALARQLNHLGYFTTLVLVGSENRLSEEARVQYRSVKALGIDCYNVDCELKEEAVALLKGLILDSALVVDALFGISLNREVTGVYSEVIDLINDYSLDVLSLDIPSGVEADTGRVLGVAVYADVTITFAYVKLGLCLYPGISYAGEIISADIGIPEIAQDRLTSPVMAIDEESFEVLPERNPNSHKGNYGKLLIVAGSYNMGGAAILAAKAAYRSGCGLVYVLTHRENRSAIISSVPEAIVYSYDDDFTGIELRELLFRASKGVDALAVGSGISTSSTASTLVSACIDLDKPLLLDADALTIISSDKNLKEAIKRRDNHTVLTPHIGEMARLTSMSAAEILDDIVGISKSFASEYNVSLCLKSATTLMSFSGERNFLNIIGNSGMATAGSGDVLLGTIGANVAMHRDYFEEAVIKGIYIHSEAGDRVSEVKGEDALIASDIIEYL